MLGHCHSVFVHGLVARLKARRSMQVSVLELLAPGTEVRGLGTLAYDQVLTRPGPQPAENRWQAVRAVLEAIPIGELVGETLRRRSFEPWRERHRELSVQRQWLQTLAGFDLLHLNYLDVSLLPLIDLIPASVPVVLSVWGSDLMDTAGVETYAAHLAICERADVITVRSLALREIFLSKFGRQFLPKMRLAAFASDLCSAIDRISKESASAAFRARHGIHPSRQIVCVGHSGCHRDRHDEILAAIEGLDSDIRHKITVVLPMTYGVEQDHLRKVREAVSASRLDIRVLTDYLSVDEVAELRRACDVLVCLPEQDALSGAMSETLYAGNAVITGAWLPYMEYWDDGVDVFRVKHIEDVPAMLRRALAEFNPARGALNGPKIRRLIDYDFVLDGWFRAYDAAALTRRSGGPMASENVG
jgi:hypothetical protein